MSTPIYTAPAARYAAEVERAHRALRSAYARTGEIPAASVAEAFVDEWVKTGQAVPAPLEVA